MKQILVYIFLGIFSFGSQAQIIVPFHLVDGFILIEAKVNNKKGKLLVDTGTKMNFFLNNNFLSLEKKSIITTGSAHSGQKLPIYSSSIQRIEILGTNLVFKNLKNVWHTDFHFMQEGIASDILGTIGYGILKDYVFSIDYNKQIIILNNQTTLLANNEVIFSFLQSEDSPNLPYIYLNLPKNKSIKAYFDTGTQGNITLTDSIYSRIKGMDILTEYNKGIWYGQKLDDNTTCALKGLSYNNILFNICNLDLKLSSENKIGLGYSFLKDYISTWDFKNKTITLSKE